MKKKGNKKMPTPRYKHPIPTSLFQCEDVFSLPNAFTTNKQNSEQRCRDGVMNEFVSWCRHLLVSFLFHALTSLHPPSFHRNDFSTCVYMYNSLHNLKEGWPQNYNTVVVSENPISEAAYHIPVYRC